MNKVIHGDCLEVMKKMESESIDMLVTSPPYFNAREYSTWETFDDYMGEMKRIFQEVYKVLKNHKHIVVNVGDIVSIGSKEPKWSSRKYATGAHFTVMLEEIGFTFIDDIIWDKGEPQSKRHLGNPPYPFYQYPVNCYEHILVFSKHEKDKVRIPCPVCNETITRSNSQSQEGVQSWECSNAECSEKSESGRGKRFSARSVMMNNYKKEENEVSEEMVNKWRRDIVELGAVIKTNSKGINTLGHTAPFPIEIPEMAISYYTGVDDVVMDCFMGSGTTAIACMNKNRNFVGIEINKEYIDIINKRIKEHQQQTELF